VVSGRHRKCVGRVGPGFDVDVVDCFPRGMTLVDLVVFVTALKSEAL
jgi:hypothetical protein